MRLQMVTPRVVAVGRISRSCSVLESTRLFGRTASRARPVWPASRGPSDVRFLSSGGACAPRMHRWRTRSLVALRHFRGRQIAPSARFLARITNGPDGNASQLVDGMANGVEHVANLPVPPFVDRDLHGCV